MTDKSVINALKAALAADEMNLEIHSHLAELLLESGEIEEADQHFCFVLSKNPSDMRALAGAAKTANALGDQSRAQGYETLLSALNPSSNVTSIKPSGNNQDRAPQDNNQDSPIKLKTVDMPDNVTIGPWEDQEPRITLRDVGGMEEVKQRLDLAFLGPLRNPELMKLYGKNVNGGLMLYGPPGCGKTFIARALAGELGAKFMSIGLSDVLDMWLGESERKLHEIFETARRNAPTVIFFDEIDALGQKRSHQRNSGGRNIVNQLLNELDSADSDNKNVFVLSATNHPWDVDTALRRPGRFDRTVLVLPPDLEARISILGYHMKERPTEKLDLAAIAQSTGLFSGADLAHLCESALENALADSIKTGDARKITQTDLQTALQDCKPSTRPWFETARNYAMFANEGGVYDDLLHYMKEKRL